MLSNYLMEEVQMDTKLLFTPGPLSTSNSVKEAARCDKGSRDEEFIQVIRDIRKSLLDIAGVGNNQGYECILMQGSGTYAVESVISSAISDSEKILIIINGTYGERIKQIAEINKIHNITYTIDDNQLPNLDDIEEIIKQNTDLTHICIIHCETTTGMMNPIAEVGSLAEKYGLIYIIDSMSAFGGVDFDFLACKAHFIVSSSNKCIQGIPGFGFIIARNDELIKCKAKARSLSLDMYSQWEALEKNGQFRFTPPVQSLLAFKQAIIELMDEGGVKGRQLRYKNNYKIISEKMTALGFTFYLNPEIHSHIIITFNQPTHLNFNFNIFYRKLSNYGFIIYPGKLHKANTFRIGCIGNIFAKDCLALIETIEKVLIEMNVEV